jgi:hypothetical protein
MTTISHAGGCLCGNVRYEATGPASNLCFCHCTSCRRSAGSPAVPWGTFALENEIDVTLGSMDDPSLLKPTSHIWMQDELPWLQVADGLPQFSGWRKEDT